MVSYEGPGLSGDDPGAAATWTNPKNPKSEKGPSDYDIRHGFVLTGVWDLPIAKGRSGAIGSLAAGWQTSGILTVHSGFPWSPKSAEQDNTPGLSYERPSGQFRGGTPDPTDPAGPADARNSQRGSRYLSLDMTFGKRTPLGDRARLELRVNCFNLLNTLNLMPFGFLNEGTFVESVNFGRVDGALAGRVVELQARVSF
jgi:hypothetical protein